MAFAPVVQSRISYFTGQSGQLAYSSNVTAGDLLIVAIAQYKEGGVPGASAVSDSQANEYIAAAAIFTYGDLSLEIWYAFATATGANTVTVNPSGDTSSTTMAIHEFSGGTSTNPVDVQDSNTNTSTGPSGGPITTLVADDLLFAVTSNGSWGSVVTITPDGDYTQMVEYEDGDLYVPMNTQYRIASGTITDTANWTLSASWAWGGWVVAFKPTVAGGGVPKHQDYYARMRQS